MQNILMVSKTTPSKDVLSNLLPAHLHKNLYTLNSAVEARRMLLERSIDLVIINTPLKDEMGEKLAKDIAYLSITQVILIVNADYYEKVAQNVEELGVIMVAKPIDRKILMTSIKIANVTYNRLKLLEQENSNLNKKIDDIRIVSRAKCILIEFKGMSEQQAHKYIEKEAMNLRKTRKEVADAIILNYG
ncbi:MAG: response regulator receiver protein [Epulopiscium sp. Nuni2H_MBin003]|nr:MAG: response regulator receiver protein [Epulopiscium sp. Nuni2H_MBin003]